MVVNWLRSGGRATTDKWGLVTLRSYLTKAVKKKNKGTEIVFETESEDIHIACNLPDRYLYTPF